MFVPFALTILWLLAVLVRVFGGFLRRQWGQFWWILLVGGTSLLIPAMLYVDISKASFALSRSDAVLLSFPCAAVICCWLAVTRHVIQIHGHRAKASSYNQRAADLVIDICLYPLILAMLATHSAFVMLTSVDSLDMSTTLAASSIFESWALASVLALFEAYARIESWTKFLVYQFLIVNVVVNAAEFYVKGVAPCELCFQIGGTSCASLAGQIETMAIKTVVPATWQQLRTSQNWLVLQMLDAPLLPTILWVSGSLAIFVVSGYEHNHRARLSGIGKDMRMWILPITLHGSLIKLLGVKMIVGVIFLQPFMLQIVLGRTRIGAIMISQQGAEFWNAWLLSLEAMLLHLFHAYFAYPASDFSSSSTEDATLLPPPIGVQERSGAVARYGAASDPESGGRGGGGSQSGTQTSETGRRSQSVDASHSVTCLEKFVIFVLGICLLASWVSLASMLNLSSCTASILNGAMVSSAGGQSVFHTCDTAKVTCSAGFALQFASGSSNDTVLGGGYATSTQAICGQDQGWVLATAGTSVKPACSICAPGHVGYPACTACSVADNCNGHAQSVTDDGQRASCQCACQGQYGGVACDSCATGHINFPACEVCSVDEHCNGHAKSVTDEGNRTSCQCTCDSRYAGPDCGQCAPGHINYPECTPCSVEQHCSAHASSVTDDGTRSTCMCSCQETFSGSTCNACSAGFVEYPACVACSSDRHCNGHADNASILFGGSSCSCSCSEGYDGSSCKECAPGHIGYPSCEQCSSETHCNGHAVSVVDDGSRSSCKCTCDEAWGGKDCGGVRTKSKSTGCTCKSSWQDCAAFGMFCETKSACEGHWLGRNWCQTDKSCESSWDYC